jgi:hypothetical protein
VEFDPEQMVCLKEISILSSRSIPWTDFAKCTALERIAIDTLDMDDSILALQNLKHLTRLANYQPWFFNTRCRHFDANYLTSLTQLQSIDINAEPSTTKEFLENALPRLIQFSAKECRACLKKLYETQSVTSLPK